MAARVRTVAFQGIDVLGVDVQVQMAGGVPAFTIVGLPDKQVAESKERVRGALTAMVSHRVVVYGVLHPFVFM